MSISLNQPHRFAFEVKTRTAAPITIGIEAGSEADKALAEFTEDKKKRRYLLKQVPYTGVKQAINHFYKNADQKEFHWRNGIYITVADDKTEKMKSGVARWWQRLGYQVRRPLGMVKIISGDAKTKFTDEHKADRLLALTQKAVGNDKIHIYTLHGTELPDVELFKKAQAKLPAGEKLVVNASVNNMQSLLGQGFGVGLLIHDKNNKPVDIALTKAQLDTLVTGAKQLLGNAAFGLESLDSLDPEQIYTKFEEISKSIRKPLYILEDVKDELYKTFDEHPAFYKKAKIDKQGNLVSQLNNEQAFLVLPKALSDKRMKLLLHSVLSKLLGVMGKIDEKAIKAFAKGASNFDKTLNLSEDQIKDILQFKDSLKLFNKPELKNALFEAVSDVSIVLSENSDLLDEICLLDNEENPTSPERALERVVVGIEEVLKDEKARTSIIKLLEVLNKEKPSATLSMAISALSTLNSQNKEELRESIPTIVQFVSNALITNDGQVDENKIQSIKNGIQFIQTITSMLMRTNFEKLAIEVPESIYGKTNTPKVSIAKDILKNPIEIPAIEIDPTLLLMKAKFILTALNQTLNEHKVKLDKLESTHIIEAIAKTKALSYKSDGFYYWLPKAKALPPQTAPLDANA